MPRWQGFFGTPAPQEPQDVSMTPETDYWSQPSVGGMPLHRFATMTGLLANAMSPSSVGGRMGRAAAGMAGQYGNLALHGEQQTRQQMMAEAAKAAKERQRQHALSGVLKRLQPPQAGGFGVRERQPEAPGAQPSAFGVPPVTTNLEGFNIARGPAPQVDLDVLAELSGLVDPAGFKAIAEQLKWGGQLPNTEESFQTARNMALARDPNVRDLVPNLMTDVAIEKGVPTMKFGQPATPGAVEAQAITAQNLSPQARLETLRQQGRLFLTPTQQAEESVRQEVGDRGLVDILHPPTTEGIKAGAIRGMTERPEERLRLLRGQAETPVTLANTLNETQRLIQTEKNRLWGGTNAMGMRIPEMENIPVEDMKGLVSLAYQAKSAEERLAAAQNRPSQPIHSDLLPSRAQLTQIEDGLFRKLGRNPSSDEVLTAYSRLLIARRKRKLPSLTPTLDTLRPSEPEE